MTNTQRNWTKAILLLGVLAFCSGLMLLYLGDYILGTSGSIVGLSLAFKNYKKLTGQETA